MNVIDINSRIEELKAKSITEGDYWSKILNHLTEFKSLTSLDKIITDDSESYWDIKCYQQLLEGIGILTSSEIQISGVSTSVEGIHWKINFTLNDTSKTIDFEDPDTDWIFEGFFKKLNDILVQNGSSKKIRMVYSASEFNTDQTFDLCYVTDETFIKLMEHSPRYAPFDSTVINSNQSIENAESNKSLDYNAFKNIVPIIENNEGRKKFFEFAILFFLLVIITEVISYFTFKTLTSPNITKTIIKILLEVGLFSMIHQGKIWALKIMIGLLVVSVIIGIGSFAAMIKTSLFALGLIPLYAIYIYGVYIFTLNRPFRDFFEQQRKDNE